MEKCNADELLKYADMVRTDAREKILGIILDSERPLTAGELHQMVKDDGTDTATVYRVLKAFLEKGLVRTVNADSTQVYYEKSCIHNPLHPHFYCEQCGSVECLKPLSFDDSMALMRMAEGREVRSVEIIIKGRCGRCVG